MIKKTKYLATLYPGPVQADFETITDARKWAESYGDTADICYVSRNGITVALHVRDTDGDSMRWFRATY